MLRSLFNRLIDFAGECWRAEYATGSPRRHGSGMCDDEAARSIGLGGASLGEQLGCNAPAADFARDDLKIPVHVRRNAR